MCLFVLMSNLRLLREDLPDAPAYSGNLSESSSTRPGLLSEVSCLRWALILWTPPHAFQEPQIDNGTEAQKR